MFSRQLVAIAALMLTVACQPRQERQSVTIDIEGIKQSSGTPAEKAEKIAVGAEQLVFTEHFKVGSDILDVALELDPKNVRARAYKAMIKPVMLTKGLLKRVQPILDQLTEKNREDFKKYVATIPNRASKEYFLDGQPDLKNEADVQAVVRDVRDAIRDARATLLSLRGEKITLNPMALVNVAREENLGSCRIGSVSFGQALDVKFCDTYVRKQIKMEEADWDALRLTLLFYQAYLSLQTAYDASGAINIHKVLSGEEKLTEKQIVELAAQQEKLGQLSDARGLREIADLGAETIEVLKTLTSNSSVLCSRYQEVRARGGFIGQYLYCIPDDWSENTGPITEALRGTTQIVYKLHNEYKGKTWMVGKRKTDVNVRSFLDGQIKDLKTQLPNKFNECGKVNGITDPTGGGIFPNGDLLQLLRAERPSYLRPTCKE